MSPFIYFAKFFLPAFSFVLLVFHCFSGSPPSPTSFYLITSYLSSLAARAAARGGSTVCRARRAWFSVPGCFVKQPGGSTVCHTGRERFSVPGCSGGSQGGSLRCAAIGGRGFWSLAALQSSQGRFAVPFPSRLSLLFIDTNYILKVPGC